MGILTKTTRQNKGFTLIEVLIALAIIAIALTAIVKASSFNVEDTIHVQNKNIADIMASNVLAQAQLGLIAPQSNQKRMLMNTTLYWTLTQASTPNKSVYKMTVAVKLSPKSSNLIILSGFRYEPH